MSDANLRPDSALDSHSDAKNARVVASADSERMRFTLDPTRGIYPVMLGTTRTDVARALETSIPTGEQVVHGPLQISFRNDAVDTISFELREGGPSLAVQSDPSTSQGPLVIGVRHFFPGATIEQLANAMSGCERTARRLDARTIMCDEGRTLLQSKPQKAGSGALSNGVSDGGMRTLVVVTVATRKIETHE